jgi:hypothetical protein
MAVDVRNFSSRLERCSRLSYRRASCQGACQHSTYSHQFRHTVKDVIVRHAVNIGIQLCLFYCEAPRDFLVGGGGSIEI